MSQTQETSASFHPVIEYKFPSRKPGAVVEETKLKHCTKCGEPKISAAPYCGRCSPPTAGLQQIEHVLKARKGRTRQEMQLYDVASLPHIAPPHKCFYFWAVHPTRWDVIFSAVETLQRLKKLIKPEGLVRNNHVVWTDADGKQRRTTPATHSWLGKLSNARVQLEYGASVSFLKTNSLREYLMAADYLFKWDNIKQKFYEEEERPERVITEFYSQEYDSLDERHAAFEQLKARLTNA